METINELVPLVVAIALIVSRYIKVLRPLLGWLPAEYRWFPPAALAASDLLVEGMRSVKDSASFGEVLLRVVVVVALAYGAGMASPHDDA